MVKNRLKPSLIDIVLKWFKKAEKHTKKLDPPVMKFCNECRHWKPNSVDWGECMKAKFEKFDARGLNAHTYRHSTCSNWRGWV